ncbi:MAG TPA: cytochrome P450 [Solirubrobacteraceae bacterium]
MAGDHRGVWLIAAGRVASYVAEQELRRASTIEGLRFTGQVAVPNVVQGLFRRRRTTVGLAARTGVDALAISFMAGLKRRYAPGPLWIRVAKDEALLLFSSADIRRVLGGSPDPFASDPEPKRRGMAHFQPDALTISRGRVWEDRRRFTEEVLDTGKPRHRLADRFASVSVEEASSLLERDVLDWDAWNAAVRRVTRRIVLGDAAAEDIELSEMLGELMDEANGLPKDAGPSELYERFYAKLESYVDRAEPGSLVGLFGDATVTRDTKPAGQVTHWLFALGDTLAANAFRCLALIATHPDAHTRVLDELASAGDLRRGEAASGLGYLDACLNEAMRLWPTTAMLSRESINDVDWNGTKVPAGTQLLLVNAFNHRDRDAYPFADRFAPEEWISGNASEDWSFNHFSHGPQGCPGAVLALLVGKAMLGTVLRERAVALTDGQLDPTRPLPAALDFFALKFACSRRGEEG